MLMKSLPALAALCLATSAGAVPSASTPQAAAVVAPPAPSPDDVCTKSGGIWLDSLKPYPTIVNAAGQQYRAAVHNGGCVFLQPGDQLVISLNPKVTQ